MKPKYRDIPITETKEKCREFIQFILESAKDNPEFCKSIFGYVLIHECKKLEKTLNEEKIELCFCSPNERKN